MNPLNELSDFGRPFKNVMEDRSLSTTKRKFRALIWFTILVLSFYVAIWQYDTYLKSFGMTKFQRIQLYQLATN